MTLKMTMGADPGETMPAVNNTILWFIALVVSCNECHKAGSK